MTFSARDISDDAFSSYQAARIDRQAVAKSVGSRVIALDAEHDLDFVQFTSTGVGWVGNRYGVLYFTEDSGKTWQRRDLKGNAGVGERPSALEGRSRTCLLPVKLDALQRH